MIEIKISSDPKFLTIVRAMVGKVCELVECSREEENQIILAVDEACSNIMKHTYHGDLGQSIEIRCESAHDKIEFVLQDCGPPIGIPAATLTTHARIFVDRSVGHDTGLAVANPSGNPIQLKLNAFERNGVSWVGKGSLELRPAGHQSRFVGELLAGGLPDNFTGIVDISSGTPFAALTLRTLNNSRGEFLLTTFPVGDALQSPPSSLIFPQIVDGAGYQTQFILLNSGPLANIRLNLFADDGTAVLLSKAPQSEFWNLDELVFSGALEPESPSVRKSCSGTAP